MICLLEERVCNLVLLWCITVIAHHCKLVKLQSSISEYKPSDLWSYDDIEVARPENQSNNRLVKNHQSDSYYPRSDDRPPATIYDDHQSSSLRNRDHFGSRTNIEIPIAAKSNDGEISISKKITFNGNNSRANNHPLWFNTLEKSAMSLPASISFNLKNLYNERKSESTKRPQENAGLIFATKTIPLNTSGSNRNKVKYQQTNYEPEYDEPALPPSLPNLEIIPFVASDALDKPKETAADRKEGIEYVEEETTPMDAATMIKKFSPPVLTEGGFVPRDPTLDELYYQAKLNRTYSTSTPAPHIIVTEITSEYRVPESPPKIRETLVEPTHHQHIEYSTTSTTTTTQKPTVTTATATTTTATPPATTASTTTTTTTTTAELTPSPTTSIVHFLTTKAANYASLASLLKHDFTSTTSTTTTSTTENPSTEESEEGEEEDSEEEDEETIPISESEPSQKESPTNNTKEEPAEPEDNFLLSNILTMIFDDYPAPTKEKTTLAPTATKKTTPFIRSTATTTVKPTTASIPPFKHVYIPSSTPSTTTTTTTTITERTSTVKSIDKMGFTSTKFSNNKTATMNETQQNQIKYVSLPQTFAYNQPVPKSTLKPVIKERPQSHNEIYHSMKSDSVISGLLKLSGCNIFGKMYKTGEQIDELTEPCSKCMCSEAGVHCIQIKC